MYRDYGDENDFEQYFLEDGEEEFLVDPEWLLDDDEDEDDLIRELDEQEEREFND